jgi:rhodanese-related sulfurtransferase
MPLTVKDMLDAANASVRRISIPEAKALVADENALVLDVRDTPEIAKSGTVAGALHVSRGMLEFRADAASPYHDPAFDKNRPVILYCASGGRSALAGKLLLDMGFHKVFNLGAFKDWAEAGGAVDHPVDPGM